MIDDINRLKIVIAIFFPEAFILVVVVVSTVKLNFMKGYEEVLIFVSGLKETNYYKIMTYIKRQYGKNNEGNT